VPIEDGMAAIVLCSCRRPRCKDPLMAVMAWSCRSCLNDWALGLDGPSEGKVACWRGGFEQLCDAEGVQLVFVLLL